jgi:fucose 4-O-acetylase-like acetyltransferase
MTSSTSDRVEAGPGLLTALSARLPGRIRIERQHDIDAVRGVAIVLVVMGHVVARDSPQGNEWYDVLKWLIYSFHMPLFMVLSGISFALSLPEFASWPSIAAFGRQRVSRLLVAYLFFGLLVIAGKLVAVHFAHVDNLPHGDVDDVLALVLHPMTSSASFVWFIYVLGLYYLTVPAFLQLTGRRPIVLFVVALMCQWVEWPDDFLLSQAFYYLPFFAAGMVLWMVRERWRRLGAASIAFFVLAFAVALALTIPCHLPKWLTGALSVPALLGLAQCLPQAWLLVLGRLGRLSLSIYLMNTLMIGVAKAVMLKFFSWDGPNFLIYFPVLLFAGVACPIAVKRLTQRHFKRIDAYI